MIVKLLTEHHLEFLSLTGDCPGSSESTLVKMANCWKSHDTAHMILYRYRYRYQMIKIYNKNWEKGVPLFLDIDTHAIS